MGQKLRARGPHIWFVFFESAMQIYNFDIYDFDLLDTIYR